MAHRKALHIWFNMLFYPSAPKTLTLVANLGEASNNVSHSNFTAFSFFVAVKYGTQHNRTTFYRFLSYFGNLEQVSNIVGICLWPK